jgi:rhodanese-related sulfurtransferase
MELHNILVPRNPECPLCGIYPSIKNLEAMILECPEVPEISSVDLEKLLETEQSAYLIIDVREPYEFQQGTIPGAISVPLSSLLSDSAALPQDKVLILICYSGQRSRTGAQHLIKKGFRIRCLSTFRPKK